MFFLAFEGLDGSGKSSLIQNVINEFKKKEIPFIKTEEPGGTPLGNQLREFIIRKNLDSSLNPLPRTELLLYEAVRAQHVEQVIKPALAQKTWVLCDRYTASTVAFQSAGRGLTRESINWLNQFATDGLEPHLNILLDLSVEESQKRREKREQQESSKADRIESESKIFHEKVRQGYLDQAKKNPSRWLVLNAQSTPQEMFEKFMEQLKVLKWLS